jgi:photosystem II stability/assembly factor-like uncharacterized protein
MKKAYSISSNLLGLVIFLLLIFNFKIYAQVKWISPSPAPGTIYTIFFVDSLYGWAAGANSTILKTTDGGETWNEQKAPIETILRKIYFSDRYKGIIIGGEVYAPYFGSVLVTTDGGNTWLDKDPIPYPSDTRGFNDMHFINENTGYIAGFEGVFKSTDMGKTWERKGGSGWATAIYFITPKIGYLGNTVGGILKTNDGGNTWQQISDMKWTWHKDIKFFNDKIGWLVSTGLYSHYGIIRKTTDGGLTWAVQDSQLNTSYNAVSVIDSLNAIVVGDGGRVQSTTDGGSNWYYEGTNDMGDYFDIISQGSKKWITGGSGGFPRIFRSKDYAHHWEIKSSVLTENSIKEISFSDSLNGWAVGYNGVLLYTSDGGVKWSPKNLFSINFASVSTPTAEDVYLAGDNGEFIKSTDGGTNWQVKNTGTWRYESKIIFFSKTLGYCFAPYEGRIYKTKDAGENWSDSISNFYYFTKSFFVDSINGWAVMPPLGDPPFGGDALFYTSDGGETWDLCSNFNYISAIYFKDALTGWLTSDLNLYKTTNAGKDWDLVAQMDGLSPYQLLFKNETEGYMIASSYKGTCGIYETFNGGKDWTPIRDYISLNSIYLNKNNTLWGVGDYGKLIMYKNTLTTVDEKGYGKYVPNSFTLFPNYPNPFNSITIIKYNLKKSGFISVKVYDILGREITTLVNEYEQAGEYSIIFNTSTIGGGLPSGIYLYRLQAGNFVETKKMLLLK